MWIQLTIKQNLLNLYPEPDSGYLLYGGSVVSIAAVLSLHVDHKLLRELDQESLSVSRPRE